jgi:hypothetical protein
MKVVLVGGWLLASTALIAEPHEQASAPRCVMASLSVRLAGQPSPTTGAHPLALRLINRGPKACVLNGYPFVALRDAKGIIPFVYRHHGDMMVTSRPPSLVLVRPGGSAYVLLDKFRCDLGERRVSTNVEIWLKGSTTRSRPVGVLAERISLCKPGIAAEGRVVNVSPFEPTLRATLDH